MKKAGWKWVGLLCAMSVSAALASATGSYALISNYYGAVQYVALDGTTPATSPVNVTSPSSFQYGSYGIGIGDFDNDGREDYLIGGYNSGSYASIFFHKRLDDAQTYAPGVAVDGGVGIYYDVMDFGVADFDHDGNLDFSVNAYDNQQVKVYRGHGDGTFELAATYSVPYYAIGMDTADVNNDGNADIVVNDYWDQARYYSCFYNYYYYYNLYGDPTENCALDEQKVSVFLGDGHGGFTQSNQRLTFAKVSSDSNYDMYSWGLSTADFDGDGKVDLAMTVYWAPHHRGNVLLVFRGNGDGTFQNEPIRTGGSVNGETYTLASIDNVDANGDGIQDLIYGSENDATVRTYLGNGDGTFTLGAVAHNAVYAMYGLSTSPDAGASDRLPPQVTLGSLPGLTNHALVTVSGTATDAGGIATVEILRNGETIAQADVAAGGTFSTSLALVEGSQSIAVRATDRAGNATTSPPATVVLDTHPPVLALDATPQFATDPTFLVQGGAADDSGLDVVTAVVNGVRVPAAVDFAGRASATVTLTPGTNTIGFEATDRAGNTSSVSGQIILDTAGPTLAVAALAPYVNQTSQTVQGTVSDTYGIASLVLVVNGATVGAPFAAAADGSFSVPVSLQEGANTIAVQAVNLAGLSSAAQTQTLVDTIAPSAVLAPLAAYTNQSSVTATGTVADSGSGIAAVALRVVGGASSGALTPDAGGAVAATLGLSEGSQTLVLDVTDRAGNTSSVSADTILDTIAPAVAIASPLAGQPFGTTTIPLTAQVTDASPSTVTFGSLLFHVAAGGGSTSGAVDLPGEGPATLVVTARDAAGNESSASVAVVVDLTAPVADLDLAGVSDGAQIGPQPGNQLLYTLHCDDLTKVTTTESWDSSFSYGFPAGGGVVQGTAPLAEGLDTFAFRLTDEVGHVTTVARSFTYDITPPAATLAGVLASPGTAVRGVIELSATATDNLTGIRAARFSVDDAAIASTANSTSYTASLDTSALADGTHTVKVTFLDGVGNATTLTSSILVDNTAPTVAVTSPSANAYLRQTIQVAAAASDATSGVAQLDLAVGGVVIKQCHATTCSAAFDTATLANGAFVVTATARDAAGNVTGSAPVLAIADNSAPSKFLVSPADGLVAGAATTLSVNVVDDNFASVECFEDGVSLGVSTAAQFSRTISLLDKVDGAVVFTCSARDLAGNVGTESATVRVQNWTIQLDPRTVNVKASGQYVQLEIDGPNVSTLLPVETKSLALAVPGGAPVPLAAKPGGYQLTTTTVNGKIVQSLTLKFDRAQLNAALKGGLASGAIKDTSNVSVRFLSGGHELDRDTIRVQP